MLLQKNNSNKQVNKFISECLAIEAESAQSAGSLTFMARALVIATLPHSNPNEAIFIRKNGHYTLTMISNPLFGLPYGSLPRLLLAWITREAIRTKSSTLSLGKTLSEFLEAMKLSQSGGVRGDATRLREQMKRLFSTQISFVYQDAKKGVCRSDQFQVARSFELWGKPMNRKTPDSTITLSKDFFEELINRPVPVDLRVLQALRRSPLQMDIYVWLTYRFSYLKRPSLIPWALLQNQFGADYADTPQGLRDFRKQFLNALHKVSTIYKEIEIDSSNEGILLKPSKTHVKAKNK